MRNLHLMEQTTYLKPHNWQVGKVISLEMSMSLCKEHRGGQVQMCLQTIRYHGPEDTSTEGISLFFFYRHHEQNAFFSILYRM